MNMSQFIDVENDQNINFKIPTPVVSFKIDKIGKCSKNGKFCSLAIFCLISNDLAVLKFRRYDWVKHPFRQLSDLFICV